MLSGGGFCSHHSNYFLNKDETKLNLLCLCQYTINHSHLFYF